MDNFEKYLSEITSLDLKEFTKYLDEDEFAMLKFHFNEYSKSQHNILLADIRNKLSPAKNLCSMLKDPIYMDEMKDLINDEIENVEKSIEYLSNIPHPKDL